MAKKASTTSKAARRIQAHADKSGTNQGFKARAQRAAVKKNAGSTKAASSGSSKGGKPE